MRTISVIVGARRDQLDGIAAENGQVAKILLPNGEVPGIIGIAFGAVTELMSAQGILGSAGDVEIVAYGDAAPLQVKFAQQSADTEQNPARVIANDKNG